MRRPSAEAARFGALIAISLLLLAASAWLAWRELLTFESIRALVAAGGIWSPVVYLVVASVLPVAWVPRALLTGVAAALFGFEFGALLGLAAGMGGAWLGYLLGKRLGHPYLQRSAGARGQRVLGFIARNGVPAVVLLRICPAMSCELVSLAGGLAAMPPRPYLLASLVGMLPGSILYAAFGSSLVGKDDAWVTITSLALFAGLSVVTVVWLRRIWRREASEAGEAAR